MAPFVAVGMLFFAMAWGGKHASSPSLVSEAPIGPGQRLARAAYATGFYTQKSIWPSRLSAVYEWPERVSLDEPWFAAGCLMAVGLSLLAVGLAHRSPGLSAAWFAYLALLSPVSGFVRSGYAVVADRYTYLATIPLFIAFSYILVWLRSGCQERRFVANMLTTTLVCATIALGALSWQLCRSWHDTESMIARAAEAGTLSRPTHLVKLAKFHEGHRQLEEAESCLHEAVKLGPNRADVANELGGYLSRRGKLRGGSIMVRAVGADRPEVRARVQQPRARPGFARKRRRSRPKNSRRASIWSHTTSRRILTSRRC